MKYTKKLFQQKDIYNTQKTEDLFVKAMKENCMFQYEHCSDYQRILDEAGFQPQNIQDFSDLVRLPFLPTLYFKHHELKSVSDKKMLIKATSSGTSGIQSNIGFDVKSLMNGAKMVIRVGKYHHLWSLCPVNYIIFGYQPTKQNQTGVSKTAFGFTLFAPALSRTFALEMTENSYKLSWDSILSKLDKYSQSKFPMRTIGFPAYTYFLLREMKEKGIKYQMPKNSMMALAGGWKQFYAEKVEKEDFYALAEEVLGIGETHIVEFFGAVEHPVLYTHCQCHQFHIPIYSRVIIRNPDDFSPMQDGEIGLVNLLTPMMNSVPLLSVMTDDLGVIHTGKCPCGLSSPRLEIIGRVGISDIVTCAAGAEEYLKEKK